MWFQKKKKSAKEAPAYGFAKESKVIRTRVRKLKIKPLEGSGGTVAQYFFCSTGV